MQGSGQNSKSGGTCILGHPQKQKRALCKLKRDTLHKQFAKERGGTCPEWHMLYIDFVQHVEKRISTRVPPVHSRNSVSSYCTQML